MKVFTRYASQSLRRSPTRTLVTIIGIVLSMSLFTAVIEGAYSGLTYLRRATAEDEGKYNGIIEVHSLEEMQSLQARPEIDASSWYQGAGWTVMWENTAFLAAAGEGLEDMTSLWFLQGRMPETAEEIALPSYASLTKAYPVGSTITLSVGRRVDNSGRELEDHEWTYGDQAELIQDTVDKTYTVTGFYDGFAFGIMSGVSANYFFLVGGEGTGYYRLFFTLKNPSKYDDFTRSLPRDMQTYSHGNLLRLYGVVAPGLMVMLYSLVGVLVFLVAFGSIALIYNAFSISVAERIHQFGILKSIGATAKQLRFTVLTEAAMLCAVGIPLGLLIGCAGIGITLYLLRDTFANLMSYSNLSTRIGLIPHPGLLLLAAAICLVTVLLSAWLPARKAVRMNAIQAIRQNGSARIAAKDVKVSPLVQKLFGFPGLMAAKSFRRDRRRRRATVMSLFLSVALFVSAFSFCSYLTDTIDTMTMGDSQSDVRVIGRYPGPDLAREDPEQTFAAFLEKDGVEDGLYFVSTNTGNTFPKDAYTQEVLDAEAQGYLYSLYENAAGDVQIPNLRTVFLQDDVFWKMCRDNGLNPADYQDLAHPAAVLYNTIATTYTDANDQCHYGSWQVLQDSAIPQEMEVIFVKDFPGYVQYDEQFDSAADTMLYFYYPQDYLDQFYEEHEHGFTPEDLDRSQAMILPKAEATTSTFYTVKAQVTNIPFAFATTDPILFLPLSRIGAVLGEERTADAVFQYEFLVESAGAGQDLVALAEALQLSGDYLDANSQMPRSLAMVVRVFAYGFIVLISLIAAANVFNTISTNVNLRRREFAMLRSVGLSQKGFRQMLHYECLVYGLRGLLWGLPAAVLMTYVIWRIVSRVVVASFYIPWQAVVIAVGSVFLVVFASMAYASRKVQRANLAEDLRNESF